MCIVACNISNNPLPRVMFKVVFSNVKQVLVMIISKHTLVINY